MSRTIDSTTKTPTKNARTPLTFVELLAAMLSDGDSAQALGLSLPLAERYMADLVRDGDGFNECRIEDAAGRLCADVHGSFWTDAAARVERIKLGKQTAIDGDDVAAVSACGYMTAGGAFALGLVAGMRLSGGAR